MQGKEKKKYVLHALNSASPQSGADRSRREINSVSAVSGTPHEVPEVAWFKEHILLCTVFDLPLQNKVLTIKTIVSQTS